MIPPRDPLARSARRTSARDDGRRAAEPRAPGQPPAPATGRAPRIAALDAGVLLLLLALALALQALAGAYAADMSRNPDEAAHLVSGLLVRDYLASGLAEPPLAYARDYYSHYPKVAIGNWPPMFYAIQGAWMLVFPASRASVLVLLAAMVATMAFVVFRTLRPRLGLPLALFGAVALLLLRPVPVFTSMVMAEIPLAFLCTFAVVAWARFLERERVRDLAAFAALAAMAVLTKGNGLFLALVPPLSIAISGRWRLLRNRPIWVAAAAVAVLTVPWIWRYLPTMRAGWGSSTLPAVADLGFYPAALVRVSGAVAIAVAALGVWSRLRRRARSSPADVALWSTAAAAIGGVVLFHALLPGRLLDPRHLIPAYPFIAMALAAGTAALADAVRRHVASPARATAAAVAVVGGALVVELLPLHVQEVHGFARPAELLASRGGAAGPLVTLISSSSGGEGAFVVALATLDGARPSHTVWRATKLLSRTSWRARDYSLRTESDTGVLRLLELAGIDAIVTDRSVRPFPHQALLDSVIATHPDRFVLRGRFPVVASGERFDDAIAVYSFVRPALAAPDSVLRQRPGYDGVQVVRRDAAAPRPGG